MYYNINLLFKLASNLNTKNNKNNTNQQTYFRSICAPLNGKKLSTRTILCRLCRY